MRKKIIFCIFSLVFSGQAVACELDFYVDSNVPKDVVFTAVSVDNKYQYTAIQVQPGHSQAWDVECAKYNIYAQEVDSNSINPFGDFAYIANPLELNGVLPIFFPTRFNQISLKDDKLNFPKQFKKIN